MQIRNKSDFKPFCQVQLRHCLRFGVLGIMLLATSSLQAVYKLDFNKGALGVDSPDYILITPKKFEAIGKRYPSLQSLALSYIQPLQGSKLYATNF